MRDRHLCMVQIGGLVQGVGMRPFLYNLAKRYHIAGSVQNQGTCVQCFLYGGKKHIQCFLHTFYHAPPPNAQITYKKEVWSKPAHVSYSNFTILESTENDQKTGYIHPDLAVCDFCLQDLQNRKSRWFAYPFTNCTNCGPRYSFICSLPYDRQHTSMREFPLCGNCASAYHDPLDRRFHAETQCCSVCGPQYTLFDSNQHIIKCVNVIEKAKEFLQQGKILAIKGVGGYHLVCHAQDRQAISTLRKRKKRPHKPFAIMAMHLQAVHKLCTLSAMEEKTLSNNKRPIVLLRRKTTTILPDSIAPNLKQLGIMLPYTPLHFLLLSESLPYLVMTSGNVSGSPICYRDEDAFEHLNPIADYFLVHNRKIVTPVEDSVVKVVEEEVLISRCGRGYAPTALPVPASQTILAVGGQQKASVCMVQAGTAHISPYIGELDLVDTSRVYTQTIDHLSRLLQIHPTCVVHDLHPDYVSTRYAKQLNLPTLAVQHHHAHMAGCMAEHGLSDTAIGVILDGTGLGNDGTIWGGEFFVGTPAKIQRVGHLEPVRLQGGDTVIKEPWKSAACYLFALGIDPQPYFPTIQPFVWQLFKQAWKNKLNVYTSSSMGRFFDCVAALVLQRTHITYDAQAAIELENGILSESGFYPFHIENADSTWVLKYGSIVRSILKDLESHVQTGVIAAKFHNTIARSSIACVCKIREQFHVNDVVLSGGVFENRYLFQEMKKSLQQNGFAVYYNQKTPLNDGGLAFGQAAVASCVLKENAYVSSDSSQNTFDSTPPCPCTNHGCGTNHQHTTDSVTPTR